MTNLLGSQRWRYNYRLHRIIKAYRASRATFDEDIKHIGKSYDTHTALGPESDYFDEYRDHLIDLHYDADQALRLIRESFALTLYHFWEKSVMDWLDVKRYLFDKHIPELLSSGYLVEKAEIDRLRLTANLIKHESGVLYNEHPIMFTPMVKDFLSKGIVPSYYDNLVMTDDDMDAFIKALEVSGPDAPPKVGFL